MTSDKMQNNNLGHDAYPKVNYPVVSEEIKFPVSLGLQSLLQAINTCAVPLVHQLIQKAPEALHEKGYNGYTALHKACLMGDRTISYLLLEGGADPNVKNDMGETPLHFACKRGVAAVVHMLVQKNGDLGLVDNNGLTMAHHAAQTGSVYVFAYLELCGSNFRIVNKRLESPLHLVCKSGHLDAFRFLIKNERCDIKQPDIDGNTPLHICAREGHSYLSWVILQKFCCSLLHVPNKNNFTPVDLAGQKKSLGNRELLPFLQASFKRPKDSVPDKPWLLWYRKLLFPGVYYALLVMILPYLSTNRQGLLGTLGMFPLYYYLLQNGHRLNHVSRMQNPTQAGMFAAGLSHTIVLHFVKIVPYILDYHFFLVVFTLSGLFMVYMYLKLFLRNPGIVRQSVFHNSSNRPMTVADLCAPPRKIDQYCVSCEIVRDMGVKHCKLCEACFQRMDHHCMFLMKCIAKNNHTFFIWFVILVLLNMIMFDVGVFFYCLARFPNMTVLEMIEELFTHEGWIFTMLLMHVASLTWGSNLVYFQLKIISHGGTTVFRAKNSVLLGTERFLNVFHFLLGREPFVDDLAVKSYVGS